MQGYGRMAAANNGASANPSLGLGGGASGGMDRLTTNSLAAAAGIGGMGGNDRTMGNTAATDGNSTEFGGEDQRKTMEFIVQLLNAQTRETALLELSKKREAVPELALVLWHSFGMPSMRSWLLWTRMLMLCRRYDLVTPGDHFGLPAPQPITTYSRSFKSRM
jgi:hypothetical protein